MASLPTRPRLRSSFSFNADGKLLVELTLMSSGRELVHRVAPFVTENAETLQALRHLLNIAALDAVRAGVFTMPEAPAPAEASADASNLPSVSAEEREEARAAALQRPESEPEPEPQAPLVLEHVPELVSSEEREAARAAALNRPEPEPEAAPARELETITAADVGALPELVSTEERDAARAAALDRMDPETSGPETPRDGVSETKDP